MDLEQRKQRKEARQYIYENEKERSYDSLVHQLRSVIENDCIEDIVLLVQEDVIKLVKNKTVRADIKAHILTIYQRHTGAIQKIAETIEGASREMTHNFHGIKDALENFSRRLEAGDYIETCCALLKLDLNLQCGINNSVVYTQQDIDLARQEGFEEGYGKCMKLHNNKKEDIIDRLEGLDLD